MHGHDGDDELLSMMRQLSIDMTKPREVNFYFVFPNQAAALEAKELLQSFKFEPDEYPIPLPWWKKLFAKPQWGVTFTQHMALQESNVKQLTTELQKIAEACGGDYDGWEANVADENIDDGKLQGIFPSN